MSLLDVIKYPVTLDFSREDLERIPASILIKWWENTPELKQYRRTYRFTSIHISSLDTTNSSRAFNINFVLIDHNQNELLLKSLKKHIEEYDPITCD